MLSVWVLHDWLSLQNFSNFTFIYWLTCVVEFEFVAAATHAKNFEAVNFGDEARRWHY